MCRGRRIKNSLSQGGDPVFMPGLEANREHCCIHIAEHRGDLRNIADIDGTNDKIFSLKTGVSLTGCGCDVMAAAERFGDDGAADHAGRPQDGNSHVGTSVFLFSVGVSWPATIAIRAMANPASWIVFRVSSARMEPRNAATSGESCPSSAVAVTGRRWMPANQIVYVNNAPISPTQAYPTTAGPSSPVGMPSMTKAGITRTRPAAVSCQPAIPIAETPSGRPHFLASTTPMPIEAAPAKPAPIPIASRPASGPSTTIATPNMPVSPHQTRHVESLSLRIATTTK